MMRARETLRWILWGGAILVAGWLLSRQCGNVELESGRPRRPSGGGPAPVPQPRARDTPRDVPGMDAKATPDAALSQPVGNRTQLERLGEDPDAAWKSPMAFYGLVWDERRRPVAGVTVQFAWEEDTPENRVTATVLTGHDGRFQLRERTGAFLTVKLMCEGYYVSRSTRRLYEFGNPSSPRHHRPDPDRPVVFFLRRHGERVALLEHRLGFELVSGARFGVDLTTGERVENGGDLEVRFHRAAPGSAGYAAWSLELVAPGILESLDEFMFDAPAEGYGRSLLLRGAARGDPPEMTQARFFLKGAEGEFYGRVLVMMTPGGEKTAAGIALHCYVNTNGSTNLEGEPF